MSQQPSRYQRSFPGMVGAMLVTVGVVLVFVLWRALFRGDADVAPEPVEWEDSVTLAQEAGLRVVHPEELPDGWTATSVDLRAGDVPRWGLGVLTDDGNFIGIRQEDTSVDELVRFYVDEDAVEGDAAEVDNEVASTWQTWSDEGGDLAFSTEVEDDSVLVYGSAPLQDLQTYLALLTR